MHALFVCMYVCSPAGVGATSSDGSRFRNVAECCDKYMYACICACMYAVMGADEQASCACIVCIHVCFYVHMYAYVCAHV